jgi:hypothetical protein
MPPKRRAPAPIRVVQAERNAIELKQGMKLEEVEKLLGKPKRASAGEPSQGTLQWSYVWAQERTPACGVHRQDAGAVDRK